jgi:hypothetical protein
MVRRLIRATLNTVADGFTLEAAEDLLVSLAVRWQHDDPAFDAKTLFERLRANRHTPVLGAVWILRTSSDPYQRERATKALAGPDAVDALAVMLRDEAFLERFPYELMAQPALYDALLSVVRAPGTLQRDALQGALSQVLTGPVDASRAIAMLEIPPSRAFIAEVLADAVHRMAAEDTTHFIDALTARLADPRVTRAACRVLRQAHLPRFAPQLQDLLPQTPHRIEVLITLLALGDREVVRQAFIAGDEALRLALIPALVEHDEGPLLRAHLSNQPTAREAALIKEHVSAERYRAAVE